MIRAHKSKIQIRLSPPDPLWGEARNCAVVRHRARARGALASGRSDHDRVLDLAPAACRGRKEAARHVCPPLWPRDLDLRSQSWDGVREGKRRVDGVGGMRVRPAGPSDAEAIAGVQARSWRAAYLGMLPNEVLLGFGYAQGVTFWQRILGRVDDGDSVLVAELESDVVGFVSCGPIRDRIPGYSGEFYALYVLPEAQGCGIGTSLIAHAGRRLIRRRWISAAVWVLEDNDFGRRFY
jgi:GNAT superfamily N-acetyltransferase